MGGFFFFFNLGLGVRERRRGREGGDIAYLFWFACEWILGSWKQNSAIACPETRTAIGSIPAFSHTQLCSCTLDWPADPSSKSPANALGVKHQLLFYSVLLQWATGGPSLPRVLHLGSPLALHSWLVLIDSGGCAWPVGLCLSCCSIKGLACSLAALPVLQVFLK